LPSFIKEGGTNQFDEKTGRSRPQMIAGGMFSLNLRISFAMNRASCSGGCAEMLMIEGATGRSIMRAIGLRYLDASRRA
jgi:hypothetical protein